MLLLDYTPSEEAPASPERGICGRVLGLLRRLPTGNTRSSIASGNGGIGSELSIPQAQHVYEVTGLGGTGDEIELHLDFLYPGSGLKDR